MAGKSGTRIFQDWLAAYGNHLDRLAQSKANGPDYELPEESGVLLEQPAGTLKQAHETAVHEQP